MADEMNPVLSAIMDSFAEQWHYSGSGFSVSSILTKASRARVGCGVSRAETAPFCASSSPESISVAS